MASKFYGGSKRTLKPVNGGGNAQKKYRADDLDLFAVLRMAMPHLAPWTLWMTTAIRTTTQLDVVTTRWTDRYLELELLFLNLKTTLVEMWAIMMICISFSLHRKGGDRGLAFLCPLLQASAGGHQLQT